MLNWPIFFDGLLAIGGLSLLGWFLSLVRQNVTHVDSMWSIFFLLASLSYVHFSGDFSTRGLIIIILVSIWSLRLCAYLTWRNWGPHEDSRYSEIRKNNEPHFWFKSIYIIFALQAFLAWVISISLYAGIDSKVPINILDFFGVGIFLFGLAWEILADSQLAKFKANPLNKEKVLNRGVWRYSRHPNYFGECCIWWGFYLLALSAGAWWAIISPILMTLLLLKVSGVSLLEQTIVIRRPAYVEYIRTTNAFWPRLPRK
jgi:steroid 5-alpha reductase family enzyme